MEVIGKDIFAGCEKLNTICIPEATREKFEKLLPELIDKFIEISIEEIDFFSSVQTLKNFMIEFGDICDEHWRKRKSDEGLYREVHFDRSPHIKAIVIHQLDSQSLDELIQNAANIKVGHFIDGGYAVYRTWVDPSKWEEVDLGLW